MLYDAQSLQCGLKLETSWNKNTLNHEKLKIETKKRKQLSVKACSKFNGELFYALCS